MYNKPNINWVQIETILNDLTMLSYLFLNGLNFIILLIFMNTLQTPFSREEGVVVDTEA